MTSPFSLEGKTALVTGGPGLFLEGGHGGPPAGREAPKDARVAPGPTGAPSKSHFPDRSPLEKPGEPSRLPPSWRAEDFESR